ncbi:MAG: insulinase family protein [Myxococcales bacterium]|nr:MAG: insulinase family protein [Myxococcales bacterium]
MNAFRIVVIISLLVFSSSFSAQAKETSSPEDKPSALSQISIVRHTLKNGLRLVLIPDETVPTVGIVVYYDVGSRNEEKGRTGFAHLFEHMMFQGSANVGKGEHIQWVEHRGGKMNGTTNSDRTNYFETLPSNELAFGLWLEADRMRSLAITKENFENQRQTVMEERRQSVDNQPYGPSMLRINELAYGEYFPYAHSTIGDMTDLQKAPLSAVQDFFNTYYAPNNAVLAISGKFEPKEAIALADKYFGSIPSRSTKAFSNPPPPKQDQPRHETIYDANAELAAFHIAYHIPPSQQKDHYALDLLAMVLGDGASSRMYQELVKKQELLQEISISTDKRRGPDLFSAWGIVQTGKKAEDARKVIYQTIDKIAKTGISARELEKVKNRIRANFVFALQSNLSRAMRFGRYEMYYGDANGLKKELDRYLEVSLDDIKQVAGKYFSENNRTVLDVLPKGKGAN